MTELQQVHDKLSGLPDVPPPLIEYRNVTVLRNGREVLNRLSFSIGLGEHAAILGPNGSGKSSLVKTITRELYPVPGGEDSWLRIMGRDRWNIFELRPLLGIVSYDWQAFCTRTYSSLEIVLSGFFASVGIWPNHVVSLKIEAKAREVMELLEISHLAERPTDELSSGEARRVLMARALVHDPKALLLDEPANSLDIRACRELRELLSKIAAQGTGILMVTHHLPEIIPEIERVILLKDGSVFLDGKKEQVLTGNNLSLLFGMDVQVTEEEGYYAAY